MKMKIGMEIMIWDIVCVFGIVSLCYYIRQYQPMISSSDKIESKMRQQFIEQVNIEEVNWIDINITSQKLNIYSTREEFISIEQLSKNKLSENELIKIKGRDQE